MSTPFNVKRGSIALARSLCYQIAGAADDSDDMDGGGYGSVDIAVILSAEVVRLQAALAQPEQPAEPVAREGFEKWAKSLPNFMDISRFETGYSDCNIDYAWVGWQAALAQIGYAAPPQRTWVGLTDEDWEQIHDRKRTALDTFAQGAVWAADQLKGRNT